jgi:hypothetical protein
MESASTNDRTTPNNKLDIIIRDNIKRNVSANRHCNFRRQKYYSERSRKDFKCKDLTINTQSFRNTKKQQKRQRTYNVTLRRVRATIVAVEKQ